MRLSNDFGSGSMASVLHSFDGDTEIIRWRPSDPVAFVTLSRPILNIRAHDLFHCVLRLLILLQRVIHNIPQYSLIGFNNETFQETIPIPPHFKANLSLITFCHSEKRMLLFAR